MTLQFTRKLIIISIASIALVGFGFWGAYMVLLKPVELKIETTSNQLKTEKQILSTLQKRVADSEEKVVQSSMLLQTKVPVEPLLEQFLLDLEKAEVLSNSFISNMNFGHAQMEIEEEIQANDSTQTSEATEPGSLEKAASDILNQETENGANVRSSQPKTQQNFLPEGIQRLTVNMSVTSPNYSEMINFLEALEQLNRITKIDSLTFSGNPEPVTIVDDFEKMEYSLEISTFFYPRLEELKDQLPQMEVPEPSHKSNPLVPYSAIE